MKKTRIKSAIPIYMAAVVWPVIGLIKPGMLLHTGTLVVTAAISAAAYVGGSKLFPGKEIEVREQARSGNAEIDRLIEEGRKRLDALQSINDILPDPTITQQLNRMKSAGEAIFAALEKDPRKSGEVHRFMSYYLPTAEKLMKNYADMAKSPVKGENITNAMRSVENSLGMIAAAFEKQLDSLYRDRSFDMESDVSVLQTILQSEGLVQTPVTTLHSDGSNKTEMPKAQAGV